MTQPLLAGCAETGRPADLGSAPIVRWAELATPIGRLRLFSTARGVLTLALPNEPPTAAEARVRRTLGRGGVTFVEDEAAHEAALHHLTAVFASAPRQYGRVSNPPLPLDLRGTPFQRLVWDAVAAIPRGETRSYGEVARAIGRPAAARAVGAANGANPLPVVIPCHRLVGADGRLAGYGGGLDLKRRLLALERDGG